MSAPPIPDSDLPPESRFRQVAAIFARGLLHCRRVAKQAEAVPAEKADAGSEDCLEVPSETSLTGDRRAAD